MGPDWGALRSFRIAEQRSYQEDCCRRLRLSWRPGQVSAMAVLASGGRDERGAGRPGDLGDRGNPGGFQLAAPREGEDGANRADQCHAGGAQPYLGGRSELEHGDGMGGWGGAAGLTGSLACAVGRRCSFAAVYGGWFCPLAFDPAAGPLAAQPQAIPHRNGPGDPGLHRRN